jgi:hypothetical protein
MYLGESVEEFFTMMRGIVIIMNQNWRGKFGTSFVALTHGAQDEIILPRVEEVPLLPEELVAEARESVEMIGDLEMVVGSVEERIFGFQKEIVRVLSVSSLEGTSLHSIPISCPRLRVCKHISNTDKSTPCSQSFRMPSFRNSSSLQMRWHRFC